MPTGKKRMDSNFDIETLDAMNKRCINLVTLAAQDYRSCDGKKRIYFAGPWFDERAALLYGTCQRIIDQVIDKTDYLVYYPKNELNETPMDAFTNNVDMINDCDAVIALVSRKDVGTAWEIGMAYALGKPVYLLGYDDTTFLSHTNVMLAFCGKCFTIDKLAKFFVEGLEEKDFVTIEDKWEGIE